MNLALNEYEAGLTDRYFRSVHQ